MSCADDFENETCGYTVYKDRWGWELEKIIIIQLCFVSENDFMS